MVGLMEFPRQAEYLLDWSPALGWSYTQFLTAKNFDSTLRFAVPAKLQPILGSPAELEKRGFQTGAPPSPDFIELIRTETGLEQNARIGTADTASALRWGFTQPAIGIARFSDSLKALKETLSNMSQGWAYEQFVRARDEYHRGQYAQALNGVTLALEGGSGHAGFPSEFRFHFLLGRIRIGSWFGDYKNDDPALIDAEIAESAFLDAARLRKQARTPASVHINEAMRQIDSAETDTGLILLWAGRAAYIAGATDRAITHTREALNALPPVLENLYAAAHYQLARVLCRRGNPADLGAASESLKKAFSTNPNLVVEAAGDPEFLTRPELVEKILSDQVQDSQKRVVKLRGDLDVQLKRLQTFRHDETPAEWLLAEETSTLRKALEETVTSTTGGLFDLENANQMLSDAVPQTGFLFGLFKTRFAKDRLQKWESQDITRAARDADSYVKWCEDEYKKAEEIYRHNGGFNRDGGTDKFGYALICLLLSIYMFFAQVRWGGHAFILGILLLSASLWFFMLYMRRKLGLVEGYEKYRATRSEANAARRDATRKDDAAAKAWLTYQNAIDQLSEMRAPF